MDKNEIEKISDEEVEQVTGGSLLKPISLEDLEKVNGGVAFPSDGEDTVKPVPAPIPFPEKPKPSPLKFPE